MDIQIRPVTFETRALFSALLEDANHWQKARGSEGWSSAFDDDWILPRIARGELHLAYLAQEAVAAFRILWEDRPFWGAREVGDSIYLHSFVVLRAKAGLGIGEAVIECVAEMGRARGMGKLRLDCFLANNGLIAFYERCGFVSVGTIMMSGRMMNLMERDI